MKRTQHSFTPLVKLVACAVLALGAAVQSQAADSKADPTGTWTWTTPGRNGGPDRKSTLKLKLDGDKVTGTVTSPGRQGGQAQDTAIEDGKLKGEELSFSVTREVNGNKFTAKYSGKLAGDTIKGKSESQRDNQPVTRDWVARKEAAAK